MNNSNSYSTISKDTSKSSISNTKSGYSMSVGLKKFKEEKKTKTTKKNSVAIARNKYKL